MPDALTRWHLGILPIKSRRCHPKLLRVQAGVLAVLEAAGGFQCVRFCYLSGAPLGAGEPEVSKHRNHPRPGGAKSLLPCGNSYIQQLSTRSQTQRSIF